jgi:hypothetical protein
MLYPSHRAPTYGGGMQRHSIAALGALAISACSPLPRQAEHLASVQVCCQSVGDMKFKDAPGAEEVETVISEESPAFAFPTGKSYFAAFRLPQSPEKGMLSVKSFRVGFLSYDSQVFCPTLTFYDERFQPLVTEAQYLYHVPPGWGTSGHWRQDRPIPEGSRYVVIHTASDQVGSKLAFTATPAGSVVYTGSAYLYVPGSPTGLSHTCGQAGKIRISIRAP